MGYVAQALPQVQPATGAAVSTPAEASQRPSSAPTASTAISPPAGGPVTAAYSGTTVNTSGASPRRPAVSGYTCVAAALRGGADALVAGTGGGRLRWLDLATGALRANMYCRPLNRWQVCCT